MVYTEEIIVKQPLNQSISLFAEPENMKKWQPGLLNYKQKKGEGRETGAITIYSYQVKKRIILMRETILENKLPGKILFKYETAGVYNFLEAQFQADGSDVTRLTTINEFRLKGLMKIIGWLMPGMFKKQTTRYLKQFKKFADNPGD